MMKYITKIRAGISIYASKKTDNLFEGSYKSIYQGNGLDFENLREYIAGDNTRDIDWKASSRSGKLLVKRYIAEKKHNIMLVFDTDKRMSAHTKSIQIKKEVALYTAGTIGYLSGKNGDQVGAIFSKNGLIQYYQLRTGMHNIERILTEYDKQELEQNGSALEKCLDYILKNSKRKMILFVISDMAGMNRLGEDVWKKLTCQHDVFFVSIGDADLSADRCFDVEKSRYIPFYLTHNKKLQEIEQNTKRRVWEENEKKLLKHGIVCTQIDGEEEIVDKITEMLGRYRYANKR